MNIEQNFLIKYGLHNFVSMHRTSMNNVFLIRSAEGPNMSNHAKNLIKECFDETAKIQII
jgi:hypothetical protein